MIFYYKRIENEQRLLLKTKKYSFSKKFNFLNEG